MLFHIEQARIAGSDHIKSLSNRELTHGLGDCFSGKERNVISSTGNINKDKTEMFECVDCVYKKTVPFTISHDFEPSDDFTLTKGFSFTSIFLGSKSFSITIRFEQSSYFSFSQKFVASAEFYKTII